MQAHNKRLTILSEEEKCTLYELPDFNETQRQEYLILNKEEKNLMLSRSDLSEQVYCALQIGYFKAKQTFFDFKWKEVPKSDIRFLMKNYFPEKYFLAQPITKYEYYTQVNKIAHLYGYRLWSKECAEELWLRYGFSLPKTVKYLIS